MCGLARFVGYVLDNVELCGSGSTVYVISEWSSMIGEDVELF